MDNIPVHSDTPTYSEHTKGLQPKHISSRHRAIMRCQIAGHTISEIAEMMGMTVPRVSLIVNSPLYKEEKLKMEEEVKQEFVKTEGSKVQSDLIRVRLKEEALASLDTLIRLRDDAGSERVRQLSAIEILDRAGYKSSDKFEGEVVIDASDGLIDAITQAMKEMREKKDASPDKQTV